MVREPSGPFESLESAQQYLGLVREALEDAYASVLDDTVQAQREGAARRVDALHVVEHKLDRLRQLLLASLLVLNDLRMLRRLLVGARSGVVTESDDEP